MASVTEEMLQNIASDIVRDFNSGGTSLTEGVRKKASDNGFNRDQTARLIERTNSEAFLSLFPKTTEFDVASPEVVLNEKVASEAPAVKTSAYKRAINRDLSEIFGITPEDHEKVASMDHADFILKSASLFAEYQALNRMQEELRMEKVAQDITMDSLCSEFYGVVKEAVYSEIPLSAIETELLQANPDDKEIVVDVVSGVAEKLASDPFLPTALLKRASVDEVDYDAKPADGKYAVAFDRLLRSPL